MDPDIVSWAPLRRLLLVPALLGAGAVVAQEAATAASLAETADRLFQRCARPGVPGAVVLVGRGDEILLQRAYGLADLERGVSLSVESVFDIGSTSKQFTAACVLLLADEGKLALADPVRKHVAELPACCDVVTLRHMLLHTSGLPDYIGLMIEAGVDVEDRTTADEALASLGRIDALEFAPGSKWAYSNSNYFLLGEVVARTAKRSLAEFARERIFVPLGMDHTHVHVDATQLVPDRALSYSRQPRGAWRWNFSNWEQTGDGAVFTTVGDLFRWSRNFRTGTVGGDGLLRAMSQPGSLDDGTAIEYGTGLMHVTVGGTAMVAHGGAWAGYRAELLRVPEHDLVVVCLCNRDDLDPERLCRSLAAAAMRR
ncbi:MAG: beta-lactamase family protein [Planctomycetes bacterium]|nr:beta-lactamase family protein [Planctomycetota bacterium]